MFYQKPWGLCSDRALNEFSVEHPRRNLNKSVLFATKSLRAKPTQAAADTLKILKQMALLPTRLESSTQTVMFVNTSLL